MPPVDPSLRFLLDSLGGSDETGFYLQKFQALPGDCFALLVADDDLPPGDRKLIRYNQEILHSLGLETRRITASELRLRQADLNTGETGGQTKADDLTAPVLPAGIFRIHVLRSQGGFHDPTGRLIPYYYTSRPNVCHLSPEDQSHAEEASAWIRHRPGIHVSFTSPFGLLRELFTVQGTGTVVRRGSRIVHATDADSIDLRRLHQMMGQAFGKRLRSDIDLGAASEFYVESEYRGAALLEQHAAGMYLSKFAVGPEARGRGLASELWQEMEAHSALFWRTRPDNPINRWYEDQADGRQTLKDWNVYWRGVPPDHVTNLIAFCQSRPPDFQET